MEPESTHKVEVFLPKHVEWYYYYSKTIENETGKKVEKFIPELEQGIWVRAGSIIPIKLHGRKLSLLRTRKSPVRLDIYLDNN